MSRINVETDRRHERRSLLPEELERLVRAARTGKSIEGISGPDRAMLYTLAAWTGFRRGELASLTLRSFNFESEPPHVTVQASYSKRRKRDTVPLHPSVVVSLKAWLQEKPEISQNSYLFVLKTPKGYFRDTAKMMERDLTQARKSWLQESSTEEELQRRESDDFLRYKNSEGLYADFHSNRHTFISNLGRAGVSPQVAKELARHSDINLTMNVYTHVEQDQ